MSTRFLAWGVMGGVSLLLATACAGSKIHDVGDVDEPGKAGSGPNENVGGDGSAGVHDDIAGSSGGGVGGSSGGGVGGSSGGVGGSHNGVAGGAPVDCFAPQNNYTEQPPTVAPQNSVFIDGHTVAPDTVKNYADQQVFTNIAGVAEANANFPISAAASDRAILLPSQLSKVAPNLGQFYVTRPDCRGKPAAGRKLTVEFWWKLGGAITGFPTHGVAMGALSDDGKAVWFEDSAKTYMTGDAESTRVLNTLGRHQVEHTFAEDDTTDAGKITVGVWLLPEFEFPTTFYIGNVKWD